LVALDENVAAEDGDLLDLVGVAPGVPAQRVVGLGQRVGIVPFLVRLANGCECLRLGGTRRRAKEREEYEKSEATPAE
jgi:hypothetical protein